VRTAADREVVVVRPRPPRARFMFSSTPIVAAGASDPWDPRHAEFVIDVAGRRRVTSGSATVGRVRSVLDMDVRGAGGWLREGARDAERQSDLPSAGSRDRRGGAVCSPHGHHESRPALPSRGGLGVGVPPRLRRERFLAAR